MPNLSICIPTYNNHQQLDWCLHSLFDNTDYDYRIILIDNESAPESHDSIRNIIQDLPEDLITIVQPGSNLKWMGSINVGLHHMDAVSSEYFCMMNDDVVFIPESKDFWKNLIDLFNDPLVGAVGPCSNFVSGNQNLFNVGTPLIVETTCLIGMCLLTKTKLLREMGGLDESLPGGDDLDLSIRMRNRGLKIVANRASYLHHIGQQTGNRVFEGYWDSHIHQERTNNAIIKKHGMKQWVSCVGHSWRKYTVDEDVKVEEYEQYTSS